MKMTKTLKQIKEENRKAIIMANHPEANSYKKALEMELGFGCGVLAFVGKNYKGKDKKHKKCVMTHHVYNKERILSQSYKYLKNASTIDNSIYGDGGESFNTFDNIGISKIIGRPLTLDRVLVALNQEPEIERGLYGILYNHFIRHDEKSGEIDILFEWDLEEDLEEQSEETQRAINKLLTDEEL